MIKIDKTIIVEGKYDKIKLSSIIDANIIQTNGFRIFKDKEKMNIIRFLAIKTGIIVITDSDIAGFKIRNYIKSCIKEGNIFNIYIPEILGKEKRKRKYSKEGKLGVEGLSNEILIKAFNSLNIKFSLDQNTGKKIQKIDFFDDGLIGRQNSKFMRQSLINYLNLPSHISTNALIDILNSIISFDEYKTIINIDEYKTIINKII